MVFIFLLKLLISTSILASDPILASVIEGGNLEDRGLLIIKTNAGVFAGGFTLSNNFSHLTGSYKGGKDIFLIKFNNDLSQVQRGIYYGGTGDEEIFDIKTDASGYIYVAGYTSSSEICPDTSVKKALVLKLDQDLNILNTLCIGGSQNAEARKLIIDGSYIYILGSTEGQIESYTGFIGNSDVFVAKVDLNLNIQDLIYIGGSGPDRGYEIITDGTYLYVGGVTGSSDLAGVSTSFQTSLNGTTDAFISKIDKSSLSLVKSTYLGGSGEEESIKLAYRSSDQTLIIILGTPSPDLPIIGGENQKGLNDIYVAVIDKNLQNLSASTYIGGSNEEFPQALSLDTSEKLYITGKTLSPDFPVLNTSVQTSYLGNGDVFIIVLNPDLSLSASTFLGGNGEDIAHSIYINDYIYLTGYTSSSDFPVKTTRIIDNQGNDMFVVYMTKSLKGRGSGFTGGDGELSQPRRTSIDKGCSTTPVILIPLLLIPFLRRFLIGKL